MLAGERERRLQVLLGVAAPAVHQLRPAQGGETDQVVARGVDGSPDLLGLPQGGDGVLGSPQPGEAVAERSAVVGEVRPPLFASRLVEHGQLLENRHRLREPAAFDQHGREIAQLLPFLALVRLRRAGGCSRRRFRAVRRQVLAAHGGAAVAGLLVEADGALGIRGDAAAGLVRVSDVAARERISALAGQAVEREGPRHVSRHAVAVHVHQAEAVAGCARAFVACRLEQGERLAERRGRIALCRGFAAQHAQVVAALRLAAVAGPLEEPRGGGRVPLHAERVPVHDAEIGAADRVAAAARLLEELHRLRRDRGRPGRSAGSRARGTTRRSRPCTRARGRPRPLAG